MKITKHGLMMRLHEVLKDQNHMAMMLASYESYTIGLEALLLAKAQDRDSLKLAFKQSFADHVKEFFTITGAEDHTYRDEFRATHCPELQQKFAQLNKSLLH